MFNEQVQADRHYVDVEYPLHPNTESPETVLGLVEQFLGDIQLQSQLRPVSEFDVLQALSIVSSVRMTAGEVSSRLGVDMAVEVLDIAPDVKVTM